MISLQKGSKLIGRLPKGCRYCEKGAKLVLLVTGLCSRRCFYCPLSIRKRGKDIVFADEKNVKNYSEVTDEAGLIDALGSGITGGDPMFVPEKTLRYIKLLKENFGESHHIHLYTAGNFEKKWINKLDDANLDEIRFHPPVYSWDKMKNTLCEKLIKESLKTKMDVGVEIPAIPGCENKMMSLAKHLDSLGVDFMNLNELEYSETNCDALNRMGFTVKNDISSAVKGSEENAISVMKNLDVDMSLHYCSSSFKDAVQLRNRIMRRAKNVAKKYDIVTKDGTLLKGVIQCRKMKTIMKELIRNYNIPENLINIDNEKKRIEIAPWVLEKIAKQLSYNCFIVEEYPTADRLEVERIRLK
ncbi:MAG: radical SAM protein [Thermoplasmatales archaeon]|nr:radical SAM protein [Thermoplasmatales archaeon]